MPPNFPSAILVGFVLAALPIGVSAQFVDPFTTIDPAWVVNRYAPGGFTSVFFGGDPRLQLTIDQSGSTANRGVTFASPFYNVQGLQRPGGITGLWTLSAQVYVSSAFDTTTGTLVRSSLWGHTGTTPAGGDYAILGFTNASPTHPVAPAALDRAFSFRAYDGNTGLWLDLGVPVGFTFDAWHTFSITSTGSAFVYSIDDALVFTNPTVAGSDLLSVMVQGYNFNQAGGYSVLWDNVTASSSIPEPAVGALTAGLTALGLAFWHRRRVSSKAGAARAQLTRHATRAQAAGAILKLKTPSAWLLCRRWVGLILPKKNASAKIT